MDSASPERRPIRLVVRDDLGRSRLTVFFRLLLAIPLLVWVTLRGIAAFVVGFVNWLAVLIQGEVPDSTHDFVASYVRYATQVSAYVFLAANPYPWFRCQSDYPVDLEIDPPVRQGRWGGFFRLVLALPALALAAALGGGFASGSSGQGSWTRVERERGRDLVERLLRRRRAPLPRHSSPGSRSSRVGPRHEDCATSSRSRSVTAAQAARLPLPAHAALSDVRSRAGRAVLRLPEHPVRIVVADDLARPRLTVLFRLFLAIPHFVWIVLWSIAAFSPSSPRGSWRS